MTLLKNFSTLCKGLKPLLPTLAVAVSQSANSCVWDLNSSFQTRTKPFGLAVNTTAGLDTLLWGQKSSPGDFMYGYLRPSLKVQTSGVVNSYDARLEVFPISIFGMALGQQQSVRLKNFSSVNCVGNICQGAVRRDYFRTSLVLGYANFFAGTIARYEWQSPSRSGSPYYDESSSLLGSAGGDTHRSLDLYAGYKISQEHKLGAIYSVENFTSSGQNNDAESLFYAYTKGELRGVFGFGAYRSSLTKRGFSAYLQLQWVFKDSLEI